MTYSLIRRGAPALALGLGLSGTLAACGARSSFLEDYPPIDGQGGGGVGGGSGGTTTSTGVTTTTTTTTTTTSMGGGTPGTVIVSEFPESVFEGETSVASAPDGRVAVAWISVSPQGEPFIAYAFSADDGKSWQPPIALPSPGDRYGSDPVLAVDAAGNIYLTWVGFKVDAGGNVGDMQIYVSKATPGALSFGPPVVASEDNPDIFYDKPWITVTNKGTVVVSWAKFDESFSEPFAILSARSTDGGQTFTRTPIIEDPSFSAFYNLAYVCAPRTGDRMYAIFLDLKQAGPQVSVTARLAASDDDGQSWPAFNLNVVSPENEVAFGDPSCVAEGNEVWVQYGRTLDDAGEGSNESAKLFDIVVRRSLDAGKSFDFVTSAADTSAAPLFMHPDIVRDQTGTVHAVYYAGQFADDENGSFRRSALLPGSTTFQPSSVVHQPIVFTPSRNVPYWLGDYVGVTTRGNRLYTSYVVNSDFTSHVGFQAFDLP